ncbi:kinase-associated lipoprotein B [Radiobacillus kanasensis]|uniref:kinase-associated lipoprotein B n=1 Tax=Radiobacillus kanasensis TaxID=2844358 RepID=UPI001E56AFF1|nr:kinase-associated lipoprotein B [Radiobacillus kanasensis]UFT98204.1 kinase-associated lipoprotein B [Radiobacillus kanasensis]
MENGQVGDTVKAHYKSGTYVGEIVEDRGQNYLIKVLAVLKHPLQGDIHNYGKTEDVFFHQRKALSFEEKMNVSKSATHPYEEEVPDYKESLKAALNTQKKKFEQEEKTAFQQKALEELNDLEKRYFRT